jgi:hypothetical protein
LNDLALEMKQTLKQLLKECVTAGRSSQGAIDPSLFPSQVRDSFWDMVSMGQLAQITGISVLGPVLSNNIPLKIWVVFPLP